MFVRQHFRHGSDNDNMFIAEYSDAVADGVQAAEVMGHHEYGDAEALLQAAQQFVEGPGADRVETGGGFVEEQDFGIECERARQSGALAHAARELHRIFRSGLRRQADKADLEGADLLDHVERQLGMFEQRHFDILRHRQRRKQRAALEQNTPARLKLAALAVVELIEVAAQYFDAPGEPLVEPDNGPQENRFAGPRRPDKAHHLGAPDIELEIFQHRHPVESDGDIAGPDGDAVMRDHHLIPRSGDNDPWGSPPRPVG